MQPANRKTAIAFHAKDDLPEVRREVFKLLPSFGASVIVAIRRKNVLAGEAVATYQLSGRKLSANAVYDELVRYVFRNTLFNADENKILFSRRGKSDRSAALNKAIERAKEDFRRKWGDRQDKPTSVSSAMPSESEGLQIIDYYLWALQRMYERSEDRFFNLVADQFSLVMDLDDTRAKGYGAWYSKNDVLTLEKMAPVTLG